MSGLRDFLLENNLKATPKSNQSIIEVALNLILNSQKGSSQYDVVESYFLDELTTRSIPCSKSGNQSKFFDIEIQFPNGQQSNLELSIRREGNGINRVFDANGFQKRLNDGCTDWLYIDAFTKSAYLLENLKAVTPNQMADLRSLMTQPQNQICGQIPTKTKVTVLNQNKTVQQLYPFMNDPPKKTSHNPSTPNLDPTDFNEKMIEKANEFRDLIVDLYQKNSEISLVGAPILFESGISRPLEAEFVNDDAVTELFPVSEYPELAYLLRYFSIVEGGPYPADDLHNRTLKFNKDTGGNLFELLYHWIEHLNNQISNGATLIGVNGWLETEYKTGMHDCNFWSGYMTRHRTTMAFAIGIDDKNNPNISEHLEKVANTLMQRFPFFVRENNVKNTNFMPTVPLNLSLNSNYKYVPIEDILSHKKQAYASCPAPQSDYSTKRERCKDYDHHKECVYFSLCDAMLSLFGPPTDKIDKTNSPCLDSWEISHILNVLREVSEQIKPLDAHVKKQIFHDMLSMWKYIPPTSGSQFNDALDNAKKSMKSANLMNVEIECFCERMRNEGIILLDMEKMYDSANHYLGHEHVLKSLVHSFDEQKYDIDRAIEHDLSSKNVTIVNYAPFYMATALVSATLKCRLSIGIDRRGRRARTPKIGSEYDVTLDGIVMGHALNILDELATNTNLGIKNLNTKRTFRLLAKGTKEVVATSSGFVPNAPPTWIIIEAISRDWTGNVFDNLESWHNTFRRTDSLDDTALLKAVMTRTKIRVKPHEFFDTN